MSLHDVVEAQPSTHFNYQAIVTDASGQPFEGAVGVKVGILKSSENGELVFSERHTLETDAKGFISFRVGEGDEVYKGDFMTIDWSDGPMFIKTEIAIGGGYMYTISTTTELVSVPLALYALKADSIAADFIETDPLFTASPASMITGEDTIRWNDLSKKVKYRIGDRFEGGIIFYVEPGGEHGLIASLDDVVTDVAWGITGTTTSAQSSYDGDSNTDLIIATQGPGDYAVNYCDALDVEGYDDWYLPSVDELFLLFKARYILNMSLGNDEDSETNGLGAASYWSSTEKDADTAYQLETGSVLIKGKSEPGTVRAIRAF
jgi:hypothetical protein